MTDEQDARAASPTPWPAPSWESPADASAPAGQPVPLGEPAAPPAPAGPSYPPPPAPGWAIPPGQLTALPVEPRSYPFFYRTPRWAAWKPIVALLMAAVLGLLAMGVLPLVGLLMDGIDLTEIAATGQIKIGPWGFLGNNVGLALCIPVAMLTQWAVMGQRPRWMSSVEGGFRWGWFARCLTVVVPIWVVLTVVEFALTGLPPDISMRPYTALMIVGILLTTPLQCAGEEYLMRGLEQRLVASYFKAETVGWVVATILSSLTFMALHGAGDPWLNLFYFSFGVAASWIGWKTGGLEASVAIHVVNNLLSEIFLPFTDFSSMFNRQKGVGDPSVLVLIAVLIAGAAALTWLAKRHQIMTRAAPGRAEVDAALAHAQRAL